MSRIIYTNRFPKKKSSRKRRKKKQDPRYTPKPATRVQRYANQLNADLPPAERWFQALWYKEGLKLETVKFNYPYSKYILDCIDCKNKFIIEIDEEYHYTEVQQFRDSVRDSYFTKRGYEVYRIKAYSVEDYLKTIEALRARLSGNSPVNEQGRTQSSGGKY